jgi:hypothetical protein
LKRAEALHCVFDSVRSRLPDGINFEVFEQIFSEWEVVPLTISNQVCGGFLIRGNELHLAYTKSPSFCIRKHLRENLGRIIHEYGFAVTCVEIGHSSSLRFCRRLGFIETGRKNGILYLRCEESNYV